MFLRLHVSMLVDPETFSLTVRDDIKLRFMKPEEASALFALVDRNRPHLRRFLPWVDAQTGPEVSLENIKKRIAEGRVGKALDLGIYMGDKLIGSMGFNKISAENKSASIGYWIAEDFQGKGTMTDCVRAIIHYGFHTLNLHRIVIRCHVDNVRSAAIPERLGFTLEGIARETHKMYDRFEDSRVYSLLSHEWTRRERGAPEA